MWEEGAAAGCRPSPDGRAEFKRARCAIALPPRSTSCRRSRPSPGAAARTFVDGVNITRCFRAITARNPATCAGCTRTDAHRRPAGAWAPLRTRSPDGIGAHAGMGWPSGRTGTLKRGRAGSLQSRPTSRRSNQSSTSSRTSSVAFRPWLRLRRTSVIPASPARGAIRRDACSAQLEDPPVRRSTRGQAVRARSTTGLRYCFTRKGGSSRLTELGHEG